MGEVETWVIIDEAPDYSVSDLGRVRNDHSGRLLTVTSTVRGGPKVGLVIDGVATSRLVKNLVAEQFVPGETDLFDTAINMDGNKMNCEAANLVWRPRWYAILYARQFNESYPNAGRGPIRNIDEDITYENVYEASVANGLLFRDVFSGCLDGEPVFPDWHCYEWLH